MPTTVGWWRVLTEGNEGLTHYQDHTLILNNERDSKYFTLLKDWIKRRSETLISTRLREGQKPSRVVSFKTMDFCKKLGKKSV